MTDDAVPTPSASVPERYRQSVGGVDHDSRQRWSLSPYRRRLIATDIAIIAGVIGLGLALSSRASAWDINPMLAVYGTPVLIALLWFSLLLLRGSYDQRFIGLGGEELTRVVSATLLTFATVAGVSFLIRADISRAYAFISLPLGLALIITSRYAWRSWLHNRRAEHELTVPTLIVGPGRGADDLWLRLTETPSSGYEPAARYSEPPPADGSLEDWLDGLDAAIRTADIGAVAVAPSEDLSTRVVRQLAWRLEGRQLDLLIAPSVVDIAGPRLTVRRAAGLPLIHLDEAALSRPQRFAKRALDLVGSIAGLLVLWPVLLVCALAVRLTSAGPAFFRQTRIGRGGRPFTMLKLRTMRDGADTERAALRSQTQHDAPMFKDAADPRITPVGRFLRRWSLDELPQLLNVAGGSMSLVGPRPHPLDDVDRYEIQAYRRLALKPGLTGLWQVEGRSDLDWAEALELDLSYVENWSLAGDLVILLRTIPVVVRGSGAV